MFFSIIVPVFNAEKTIKQSIESVKRQTFDDWEMILVDDGSTDESRAICQEYQKQDPRIRYYYQTTGGAASARNHGIQEARGKFITFLDSDDCYHGSYLLSFYECIQGNPACDHFWCGYDMVCDGRVRQSFVLDEAAEIVSSDRKCTMTLYDYVLLQACWNKAYRRTIIEKYNLCMREEFSLGEDLLFNLDYLASADNTEILFVNRPLYQYIRGSEPTLNSKYRPDLKEIYEALQDAMRDKLEKWELEPDQMQRFFSAEYNMLINVMRNTFRRINTLPYREKIAFNNDIIRSARFKEAVANLKESIHPAYRLAYSLADYRLIRFLDKLYEIKKKHASQKRV